MLLGMWVCKGFGEIKSPLLSLNKIQSAFYLENREKSIQSKDHYINLKNLE